MTSYQNSPATGFAGAAAFDLLFDRPGGPFGLGHGIFGWRLGGPPMGPRLRWRHGGLRRSGRWVRRRSGRVRWWTRRALTLSRAGREVP